MIRVCPRPKPQIRPVKGAGSIDSNFLGSSRPAESIWDRREFMGQRRLSGGANPLNGGAPGRI